MTLHIEYLNTKTIKPYKQNPRIHKSKQIAQIAQSIQAFAFNNPLLIDEKNEINSCQALIHFWKKREIDR